MKAVIIIGIIVLALGIGAFFILAPAPPTPALLYVHSGTVEVNTGNTWIAATNEMKLNEGAQVRTLEGEATVVLLEGEFISLAPNSHIVIDTLRSKTIKTTQLAGETWNKVTKISGITDFSSTTPTTVATVRGTEYILELLYLLVDTGIVDYSEHDGLKRIQVRSNQKASADDFITHQLTAEDKARFDSYRAKYIDVLRQIRLREIQKHQTLLKMAADQGVTFDQIKLWLEEVDTGKKHEDELYHQVPFFLRAKAERTYQLTKLIKDALRQ